MGRRLSRPTKTAASEQPDGGEHLPRGDRVDAASLPHSGRHELNSRAARLDNEHHEAEQAERSEPGRYPAMPRRSADGARARQDGCVPSHDRQHRAGGMHPSGPVGLRGGPAVEDRDQNIADCIDGSKRQKCPSPACPDCSNGEDGANEKQRSLQTERGVHQPGQRGGARGYPEITDEVVGVTVIRPKSFGRNSFEDQIHQCTGHPRSGRAEGLPWSRRGTCHHGRPPLCRR